MPSLQLLPLFVTLLLSSVPQSDASYDPYCNCTTTPYECGSLKFDHDYPFSADGVNRPDYCSYPGHRLFCQNGNLVIHMNTSTKGFQVTSVDYDNHVLTVVDQGLLSQSQPCLPQNYRNTTIDTTMFMYTDRDQFLTVYVNCSATSSSLPPATNLFSCVTGGSSYYRLDNTVLPDYLGVCSTTLLVPFNSTMAGSLTARNSSVGDAVRGGFALRWKAGTGWCSECKASGGRCGFDPTSFNNQICYCLDGPTVRSCSSASGGRFLNNRRKKFQIDDHRSLHLCASTGGVLCLMESPYARGRTEFVSSFFVVNPATNKSRRVPYGDDAVTAGCAYDPETSPRDGFLLVVPEPAVDGGACRRFRWVSSRRGGWRASKAAVTGLPPVEEWKSKPVYVDERVLIFARSWRHRCIYLTT